ncbi:SDR family oxidoreductase [Nocardiopsis changdeensis]|uniref:SDR family oxidoreductase n=1 Tax=Nocardiopsis changdeensis TaxID=2831969 RepID=UPI003F475D38
MTLRPAETEGGADMGEAVVLVTGGSRGVGAEVASLLAEREDVGTVVVNHRDERKGWMARAVAARVEAAGRRALVLRADLTDPDETRDMLDSLEEAVGRLDGLVLNASGGLESWADEGYAMRINADSPAQLVDAALPLMRPGGRIAFVTSHWAHFERYESPVYAPVARSKQAGEAALRARTAQLAERGVALTVVSGDVIADSPIALMLDRLNPGWMAARRDRVGSLPDTREFAGAIVDAVVPDGRGARPSATVYVGSTRM